LDECLGVEPRRDDIALAEGLCDLRWGGGWIILAEALHDWGRRSVQYYLRMYPLPKRKHNTTITKFKWLMLFKEITAVYCENCDVEFLICYSRQYIQLPLGLKGRRFLFIKSATLWKFDELGFHTWFYSNTQVQSTYVSDTGFYFFKYIFVNMFPW
jgi:hypothetical protein